VIIRGTGILRAIVQIIRKVVRAMPLSITALVSLKAKDLPASGGTYRITFDNKLVVTAITPVGSRSFPLIKTALEQGFLAPKEEAFWRGAFARDNFSPLDAENQKHMREFCKTNVLSFAETLKGQAPLRVDIHEYDNEVGRYVEFHGVVTSVFSVEL